MYAWTMLVAHCMMLVGEVGWAFAVYRTLASASRGRRRFFVAVVVTATVSLVVSIAYDLSGPPTNGPSAVSIAASLLTGASFLVSGVFMYANQTHPRKAP